MDGAMNFHQIRPFVRFAQYTAGTRQPRFVQAYDHRLFYVLGGQGDVWVDGAVHSVEPGSLLYWLSGSPYTFLPEDGTELTMIGINFDFTWAHADITLPLAPSNDYREESRLENVRFTDLELLNAPIVLSDMSCILPDLQAMMEVAEHTGMLSAMRLSGMLVSVLSRMLSCAERERQPHARICAAVLDYIHTHYAEPMDNTTLAQAFNYHPGYVSQLVAEQTGHPLHQYLLQVRIRQAIALLQSTDLPVNEIAVRVGFQNVSYFSQYFKKQTGCPPSGFRGKGPVPAAGKKPSP